jgi:hypothetical protein
MRSHWTSRCCEGCGGQAAPSNGQALAKRRFLGRGAALSARMAEATSVAARLELPQESQGVTAPRVPGDKPYKAEDTVAAVAARLALGKRNTVFLPILSCVAIARPGHPWRCKAQICCWSANRCARRRYASSWAMLGGDGGGTGTATMPSGVVTAAWLSAALTALRAWLCVLNTWSRTPARFCHRRKRSATWSAAEARCRAPSA